MALKIYNKYRDDYFKKQHKIFCLEHKQEEWFLEKYHPIRSHAIKMEKFRLKNEVYHKQFMEELSQGKFSDLHLSITEEEFCKLKN